MKKKIFSLLALVMVAMTASAYSLNVGTSEQGKITFKVGEITNATEANEGDVVTVIVTPNTGYVVKEVTGEWFAAVAASRTRGISTLKEVTLTAAGENTWTFVMERANVEINATYKKLIQDAWITVGAANFTYDGTEKKPSVTVKDGEATLPATAYNVSYKDNVNAGDEAVVIVTINAANSTYAGSASAKFSIGKATITDLILRDSVLTYAYSDVTVVVSKVMAGTLDVPAEGYTLTDGTAKEVGNYVAKVTGKGNFEGSATAKFRIKPIETKVDMGANETSEGEDNGEEVSNVTVNITVPEDVADKVTKEEREVVNEETGEKETVEVTVIPVTLGSVAVSEETGTTGGDDNKEVAVSIPGEIKSGNVVLQITEIAADAIPEKVDKVKLPETKDALIVAEGAMKPGGKLIEVESPLSLLDDYSLMSSLKENFESNMIKATVKAPNKYWTFSSGVDCVLPETVTAHIAIWDNGTPRIVPLDESQLTLGNGRRGIKANNGVLIASEKGNPCEIVASPGNQASGTQPAKSDANSYEGNCLVPTIEATNYEAGKYLILKDNEFHTIKSTDSKVKPCKAVFSLVKAGVK